MDMARRIASKSSMTLAPESAPFMRSAK